jgi:hypothetical protein
MGEDYSSSADDEAARQKKAADVRNMIMAMLTQYQVPQYPGIQWPGGQQRGIGDISRTGQEGVVSLEDTNPELADKISRGIMFGTKMAMNAANPILGKIYSKVVDQGWKGHLADRAHQADMRARVSDFMDDLNNPNPDKQTYSFQDLTTNPTMGPLRGSATVDFGRPEPALPSFGMDPNSFDFDPRGMDFGDFGDFGRPNPNLADVAPPSFGFGTNDQDAPDPGNPDPEAPDPEGTF